MMSKAIDNRISRGNSPDMMLKQESFKKLLNSHSSIYNALTNPDLDVSENIASRLTPELIDSQFSITSWQSISNESIVQQLKRTSSILSVTSDEEEPVVVNDVVPSKEVMVFETDEEDEDNSTSLIMPKLSVSDSISNSKRFQVTVLSSCNNYKAETNSLIKKIEEEINFNLINIRHLNLNCNTSAFEKSIIKNSDLIFIVNDGSFIFVDFFSSIQFNEASLPKLTIINMITVNYFINLFELINHLKPYQIWKASSLKQETLLNKFKNFIEGELSHICTRISEKNKVKSLTLSGTDSLNLISDNKPNYKVIEKKFKYDLRLSTSFNDPLQVSSKFFHFNLLISILKKFFSTNNSCWLICSFGIGLGIGISSGLALLKFYVYDSTSNVIEPIIVDTGKSHFLNHYNSNLNELVDFSMVNQLVDSDLFDTFRYYFDICSSNLKFFSSFVFECVKGGLEKVVSLMLYSHR